MHTLKLPQPKAQTTRSRAGRYLLAAFLLMAFMMPGIAANAQCDTWNNLGPSGIIPPTTYINIIAVDPFGTPYEAHNGGVHKYDGSTWVPVGASSFLATYTDHMSMSIDANGTPYIAYVDYAHGVKASVIKFDGLNWVYVGLPGISDDTVKNTEIAIDKWGTPYIVYTNQGIYDVASGDFKLSVKKFNGSHWITVGEDRFTPSVLSLAPKIAIDTAGVPYVAFAEGMFYDSHVAVMKCSGVSWQYVDEGGIAMDNQNALDITMNSAGIPYIVAEDDGNAGKAIVKKFNGTHWELVGSGAVSDSAVHTVRIKMDDNDVPYVMYNDAAYSSRATVKKLSGSVWTTVGSRGFTTWGILDYLTSFAVGKDDAAYVANFDYGTNPVMKLTHATNPITGNNNLCVGGTTTLSNVTGGGAWSSSHTAVAMISGSGVVTGMAAGVAKITYTAGACMVSRQVTVNASVGAGSISGITYACTGGITNLSNSVMGGTWSSSNTAIASVITSTGVVSGVATGTAIITYTVNNGCGPASTNSIVSVNTLPAAVTVLGSMAVCAGQFTSLSATIAGGDWTSGNTSVARVVMSNGIVTGITAGTAVITYKLNNWCGSNATLKTVTVNASPDAGSITGSPFVTTGSTISLAASATGGTWSAGNTNASISSTGVVSGLTTGTVAISYSKTAGGCTASATKIIGITTEYVCGEWRRTISGNIGGYNSSSVSIAVSNAGIPYIAYVDEYAGTGAVKRFVSGAWESVGSDYFTSDYTMSPQIALDGTGMPYVYYLNAGDHYKGKVVRYNGSSWTGVGDIQSSGSELVPNGISLKIDNNDQPCIGYQDFYYNGVVKRYNGTKWAFLGYASFADINAMIFDKNNDLYMVYTHWEGGYGVQKSNHGGWVQLGSETFHANKIGANCLNIDVNGILRIAYADEDAGSKVTVKKFNGSTWVNEGTTGFSDGSATVVSIASDSSGSVYIAYADESYITSPTSLANAVVKKFNGSTWATVGIGGFTAGLYQALSIVFSNNVPYIAFSEAVNTGVDDGYIKVNILNLAHEVAPIVSTTTGCTTTMSDLTVGGTWTSSNTGVAVVGSADGVVTAIMPGTTFISYTVGSCNVSYSQSINILPGGGAIAGPDSICLSTGAILLDTMESSWSGNDWHSTNTGVVNNEPYGGAAIDAVGIGTATMYHARGTCIAKHDITVIGPYAGNITGNIPFNVGETIMLHSTVAGGFWYTADFLVSFFEGYSIGTPGLLDGVATGTTTIYYQADNGCGMAESSTTVTVNPASAITGVTSVCAGANITLAHSVTGGQWLSEDGSVASVDAGSGVVTGIASGTVTISYLFAPYFYYGTSIVVTVNGSVTPITSTTVGCTTILSNITPGGTWTSGNTAVATIATVSGRVSALTPGTSLISYTVGTCVATYVQSVSVLPGGGGLTGPDSICIGFWGDYIDTMSSALEDTIKWTLSNTTVASLGAWALDNEGAFGLSLGTATIYHTKGTCLSSHDFRIVGPYAGEITGNVPVRAGEVLTTISGTISGGTWDDGYSDIASTYGNMITGLSAGTVVVTYTANNGCGDASVTAVVTVNPVLPITGITDICAETTTTLSHPIPGGTWTSESDLVASIDPVTGVVTAHLLGVESSYTTIRYVLPLDYAYVEAVTTVNVTNPPGAYIDGADEVAIGSTISLIGYEGGGTWSGSNSHATVSGGGVVTGLSAGTANITYTYTNSCGSAYDVKLITVTGGAITGVLTVCPGNTSMLSYTTTGGTWSSGNTSVATVNTSTGVVSGVAAGTAVISYTLPSSSVVTAVVTVSGVTAGPVTGPTAVAIGSTITLSNSAAGGLWFGSNDAVATINGSGIVTGISAGTVSIVYVLTNSCGTTVRFASVAVMNPITGAMAVCPGATTTLANATSGGTWSSSNTAVAAIGSATGMVSGVAAGNATITYSVAGNYVTAIVTVNAAPDAGSISGIATLCAGSATTLTASTGGGTWSSGNTAVATIGSTGVVTAVAAGNAVVTYAVSNGCGTAIATQSVTVNPLPSAGLISGVVAVCSGATTTLSNTIAGGTWSSGNTAVATIGPATGIVAGVAAGNAVITYTAANGCGSAFVTRSVTVNALPSAGTLSGSATVCASATTTLSSSVSGGTWSSSNTAVATTGSASGIVTGIAGGAATITYTVINGCGTATTTKAITINALPTAGTVSGASSVAVGAGITLTNSVSGGTWSVSNTNASITSGGVLTGITAGTVTASYTVTNGCGSAYAIKDIAVGVMMAPITGTLTVCTGYTTALADATAGGSWASNNTAVATIGATGIVTGIAAGTTGITYTVMGTTATAVVTVTATPPAISGSNSVCLNATTALGNATTGGTWSSSNTAVLTIDATGNASGIAVGTATVTYTMGSGCYRTIGMTVKPLPAPITGATTLCAGTTTTLSDVTGVGVSWTSSNTSVATIGSATGVVSGLSAGTALMTYTINTGCSITTTVSVISLPAAFTGATNICAGATTALTSDDAGGTWNSSNTAVATIGSASGIVSGIAAGATTITYTLSAGCRRTAVINVSPLPATITGGTTICMGLTTTLASSTAGGTWLSSNTAVATAATSGIVTGTGTGNATITYVLATGCARSVVVTVNAALPAITGTTLTCVGLTTTLGIAATGGTWSSSNTGVATAVSATGVVNGLSAGTANITYAIGAGCKTSTMVTINAAVPAITGSTYVCANSVITLANSLAGGTWSSSNTAFGTIDAVSGMLSGISAGVPVITYTTAAGCYKTANIAVKAQPVAIAGNTALCVGATSVVTDATPTGVSWTSGNPSVATIGSGSGLVTGIAPGTTLITYLANSGCSITRVVTVDAVPAVAAISGAATVAVAHTITLSSTTPAGTWSSSNTAKATVGTSGDVAGIAAGSATISYAVMNGVCKATVTKTITVTASRTAADAVQEAAVVKLYPNPNSGAFTVQTTVVGTFTIYTLEGKELQSSRVAEGSNSLILPHDIAAGIYMCRYNGDDGSAVMVRLVYEP